MHEAVKSLFVPCAQVDEGLYGLVGVCGYVLPLGALNDFDHVVDEIAKVGDAVIYVCGFVHAHEGFVEDCEEVPEEEKGDWLFDNGEHLLFVTLARHKFEVLFEMGEEFGAFAHFLVNL